MTGIMTDLLELTSEYGAHNYHPLPIVAAEAEGYGLPTSKGVGTWTCSPRIPR